MSRRSAAHEVATVGLMVAVIEVCKLVMQGLPNIEMTSFLVILFTLRFGPLALYAVPVFILIEGMLYGFGLWWVMYLYAWPLLALITRAFSRSDSAFFWAFVSGVFGLLFGLLCSLPYFFIGLPGGLASGLRQMLAWWIAGIPYDLIHGVSNFALMLALYRPISNLLQRMPQITGI
ncbi:MAG: hypothetical protein E7321_01615 [Clostridiales bacterium]|nr:hypothetical protein [Clostridiales bacterium]